MKRLSALLAWALACLCHGALLQRGVSPKLKVPTEHSAFLAKKSDVGSSGAQPWLYNPPAAPLPRSKPLEMPGAPLVLPPVDAMWGMQPSASPPTIEPPKNKGETGLQATIPPKELDGWYATIPPQMIKDGLVDDRTAYYVRCLGGPVPCPMTVPPAVLRYWMPVSQQALSAAQASTSLADTTEAGSTVVNTTGTMVGFAANSQVIIDAGTPIQEVNFIKSLNPLTLAFPLRYTHLKGILITIPKPTTPPPLMMPTMRPWAAFQPFFPILPGPAPGPAPAPMPAMFMPRYMPGMLSPAGAPPAASPYGALAPAPALFFR